MPFRLARSPVHILVPHRSSAEAAAKASDARLKQALAEIGRWKAAAENKRSAALEQASRQAVEGTRLHQGEINPDCVKPAHGSSYCCSSVWAPCTVPGADC